MSALSCECSETSEMWVGQLVDGVHFDGSPSFHFSLSAFVPNLSSFSQLNEVMVGWGLKIWDAYRS